MRLTARVLLWAALAVVLSLLTALWALPKLLGWVSLAVLSGSMEPTIPVGSQIVVERLEGADDAARIVVGDVITYLPQPGQSTLVTHRVVEVHRQADGVTAFTTKGDANDAADPQRVLAEQIRGKYLYHIPWMGRFTTALDGGTRGTLITVAAVALIGYAAYQFGAALLAWRSKRAKTDSSGSSDEEPAEPPAPPGTGRGRR